MAKTIASQDLKIRDLKNKLQDKEHELIMMKADLCRGCQYRNDYKNLFKIYRVKEQECEELKEDYAELEKENGELKAENFAFEGLVKTQDNLIDDLQSKNDSIQNIADDLQRRNHDLTQMLETKEKELEKAKELNHCMSGQMDFIKFELELKLSAEIKNKNCIIKELKRVDKQKDKWREKAEKLRNTLNEIKKKCSKYQTCIIVLKKDILNIINKEKETK